MIIWRYGSAPEAELHPAQQHESHGDQDAKRYGPQTSAEQFVDDCQQEEAQTNTEIPPAPVLRLESAHMTIVDERRRKLLARGFEPASHFGARGESSVL